MIDELTLLYDETLPGGGLWSGIVRSHCVLRLTDLEGGANVSLMAWNAAATHDRMNLPDTLKAQYTAKLTRGDVTAKYGTRTYQEARNDWFRNAHDNFLVEAGKHGLGPRDLMANVNFFSRLDAGEDGKLAFHTGHSQPGSQVTLRAEMDVLVCLTTCQHPLDPNPEYLPKPVLLEVLAGSAATADDYCRNFRDENQRAFSLTERFLA